MSRDCKRLEAVVRQGLLCESEVGERRLLELDAVPGLYVAVSIGGRLKARATCNLDANNFHQMPRRETTDN